MKGGATMDDDTIERMEELVAWLSSQHTGNELVIPRLHIMLGSCLYPVTTPELDTSVIGSG